MGRVSLGLRELIGSGDRIMFATLPVAAVGIVLNLAFPSVFEVGGPPDALRVISIAVLAIGVAIWAWSVALILTVARRGALITTGPFAVVRHPLYVGVSLLVLPWLGFLLNTWLGAAVGLVMYLATRRYAPAEDAALSERFGAGWEGYAASVRLPRL